MDTVEEIDPLVTAGHLKNPLEEENFDLIFTGLQSDDLGMGQTGVILGEMLGMTTASLVMATEVSAGNIKVKRELEAGWFQWVSLSLPASITIQSGLNTPRYPSLKGIMGAKKKEIKVIEGEGTDAGQSIVKMYLPQSEKQTILIEGSADQVVEKLMDSFRNNINVL